MKLNCVSCGHSLDLHEDYDDYQGQVKCYVCDALLLVLTEKGNIKRVTLCPPATQESNSRLHSMSS